MRKVAALLAVLTLAGTAGALPAEAQGVPQGSYQQTCSNIGGSGDALVATCRRGDGRDTRSSLSGYRRCVGDIGNNNGVLQCTAASGQLRGQVIAEAGPQRPPYGGSPGGPYNGGPPYGGGPGYGAPGYGAPGYGAPPPPNRGDWADRCRDLRRDARDLRYRISNEYNPYERGRLEERLRNIQAWERGCY